MQRSHTLDGNDFTENLREYGGRVPTSGSDFEQSGLARIRDGLERQFRRSRDDVRLRDRLAVADGQRRVLIGTTGKRLVDEQVPGYVAHRIEHTAVTHPEFPHAVDHAIAHALGCEAAVRCGTHSSWRRDCAASQ